MCLLVLAWRVHARYRLVVAANRDEFHARAAAPLAKWPPPPDLLAGRDLRSQGTWFGIDRERRFGVVTNFRELQAPRPAAPSRGELVPDYLGTRPGATGVKPPHEISPAVTDEPAPDTKTRNFVGTPVRAADFLAALEPRAALYSGFNLLLSDADSLWYASNRTTPFARELRPAVYGLANESLDTPWPKLQRVRSGFEAWLRRPPHEISPAVTDESAAVDETRNFVGTPGQGTSADVEGLFRLLADRTPAQDSPQAHTGALPAEWARALSAPFVLNPEYGTRCSTVLLLEGGGRLQLAERRFDPDGRLTGQTDFRLQPDEWP
jgi:uncharacterized protein with NRDE domain